MSTKYKTISEIEEYVESKASQPINKLIYPHKLEEMINNDESEPASYIRLIPLMTKRTVDVAAQLTKESMKPMKISQIILPIMPVEDVIQNNWTSVQGTHLLAEYMKYGKIKGVAKYAAFKAERTLGGLLPAEIAYAMKQGFRGSGVDNPHEKVLYAGHNRRSIPMAWEFMKPESEEEEETLRIILEFIRMTAVGAYGEQVITAPISWKIEFVSEPYENFLMYRRCGIDNVTVRFGGDGSFKAMESGMPFASLSMSMNELDYPRPEDFRIRNK